MFNKFNKIFEPMIFPLWGLWGVLGAYRGHKFYLYRYNRDKKYDKTLNYYYTTDTFYSIWAGAIYICPVTIPVTSIYEIYKLEETIRGIDTNDD